MPPKVSKKFEERCRLQLRCRRKSNRECSMKKTAIATALTMMCGSAFAQTNTSPAAQTDTSNKPGMSAPTAVGGSTTSGMNNDGMKKGTMSNDSMSKGGESKDGQGQANKGGTSK